jgi:hypothetical protein
VNFGRRHGEAVDHQQAADEHGGDGGHEVLCIKRHFKIP